MSETSFVITHRAKIEDGIEQFMGQGKEYVNLTAISGTRDRECGRYVLKSFKERLDAEKELSKYQDLRLAGIPVPNTCKIYESNGNYYLIYTDLSKDNTIPLVSSSSSAKEWQALEFKPEDLTQISNDVDSYMHMAVEAGYICGADCFFILKNNNTYSIVAGDLGIGVNKTVDTDVTNPEQFVTEQKMKFMQMINDKVDGRVS